MLPTIFRRTEHPVGQRIQSIK